MQNELRQQFSISHAFPVHFTRGALAPANLLLRDTLLCAGNKRHRVLVALDSNVGAATPALRAQLLAYAAAHKDALEWAGEPFVVRGGEMCKNEPREVTALHGLVASRQIDRQSFMLCIGGGAVLDAVGYAAATAHRGVRLIRMPTTVLGQNDAGVGVKNGINAFGRKNFVGASRRPSR